MSAIPERVYLSPDRQWAKTRTPICTEEYVRARPEGGGGSNGYEYETTALLASGDRVKVRISRDGNRLEMDGVRYAALATDRAAREPVPEPIAECPGCQQGDPPRLLDEDGTLVSLSGNPGRWGHAHDDYYWFCAQYMAREPVPEGAVPEPWDEPWRPEVKVIEGDADAFRRDIREIEIDGKRYVRAPEGAVPVTEAIRVLKRDDQTACPDLAFKASFHLTRRSDGTIRFASGCNGVAAAEVVCILVLTDEQRARLAARVGAGRAGSGVADES